MSELKKIKEISKKRFLNAGYGIFNHSAVEICSWTKNAVLGLPSCYKQKFYGVEAHRCMQMSPCFNLCTERCIFCWRPNEFFNKVNWEWDKPKKIIEKLVELRKQKLSGFFGNEKVVKEKLEEAYYLFPNHWAVSLSGEPTLYPYLPELFEELRKNKELRSSFLVSNGTEVEVIKKMGKDKEKQPIQMYISVNSWDYKSFLEINRPVGDEKEKKELWENYLKSLELLRKYDRSVLRFTVIRGVNDNPNNFKDLLEIAKSDFIEVKSYMHIGLSRKRLSKENMLNFEEVKAFAKELEKFGYKIIDEYKRSLIVLLKRKESEKSQFIVFNDFGKEIVFDENIRIFQLLNFKKIFPLFKKLGIIYWENDTKKLIEYGKEKFNIVKKFLIENYEEKIVIKEQ